MAYRYKTSINFNGYQFGYGYSYINWQFAEQYFVDGVFNNLGELIDTIIIELPLSIGISILSYNTNGNVLNMIIETNTYYPNESNGDLIGFRFFDSNESPFISKWIAYEVELCPTCQDVTIDNCGSIIFQAAIPNGTYEVQIEDHQSGITYMQDIEFTGSQGTWDQTNTAGVFTPFSVYTVTILDASGYPVSWVDGSNEYNCMRMTFATFTDTTPEPAGDGYRLEVTFLAEYFPYDSVNLYYQTCTENLILNGNTILQVGNSLVSVLNGLGGTASYVINNLTLTVTWLNPPTACGNPVSLNFFGNYGTEANSQWIHL